MTGSLVRAWARGAAIRPVPGYAIVPAPSLRHIEEELAREANHGPASMDVAFERFEATQPEVAARIQEVLERPLDETALALGYFLSIAVWLAFERAFAGRLGEVSADAWSATVDALTLEEDLRKTDAAEPFELEGILTREQPDVRAFVHEHMEAALETGIPNDDDGCEDDAPPVEVLMDDVQLVYRTILLETLALSHAVKPSEGAAEEASPELLA